MMIDELTPCLKDALIGDIIETEIIQKKYKMSLDNMAEPIMPSQLPKVKMDLAGLSRYAKKKGTSLHNLSDEEKRRFIPI